jgi:hypothetical protein
MRREATPSSAYKDALLRRVSGTPAETVARRPAVRWAAVGVASVTLFFGMGTGVYAYESPSVVDGHPLYFMKRGMESMELRLAVTPEARARHHAKMLDRRMSEAERLFDSGETVDALLQTAADELDLTVRELEADGRDPETRRAIVERLRKQNERYEKALDRVREGEGHRPPLPPSKALRERIESVGSWPKH